MAPPGWAIYPFPVVVGQNAAWKVLDLAIQAEQAQPRHVDSKFDEKFKLLFEKLGRVLADQVPLLCKYVGHRNLLTTSCTLKNWNFDKFLTKKLKKSGKKFAKHRWVLSWHLDAKILNNYRQNQAVGGIIACFKVLAKFSKSFCEFWRQNLLDVAEVASHLKLCWMFLYLKPSLSENVTSGGKSSCT